MRATREDDQAKRHRLGLVAAQGDAEAQCHLGDMHCLGQGGPVDFAEARRLYRLAAAQGYANAQSILGFMPPTAKAGQLTLPRRGGSTGSLQRRAMTMRSAISAACTATAMAVR